MRHSLVNGSLMRIGSRCTDRKIPGSMMVGTGDVDGAGGWLFP